MTCRADPVLFLARSLDRGGAERQLVELCKRMAANSRRVSAALFYGQGALVHELAQAGVSVIDLRKRGRWDIALFLLRLARAVRQERPVVLHTYLTVPNIIGVLLKPLLPGTRIVWGLRATDLDLTHYDLLARLSIDLERVLSRWADLIITNSEAGRFDAVRRGFPLARIVVVPNGIDTTRFSFSSEAREALRREWGIGTSDLLIGLTARLDPMKDHSVFLDAAARVAARVPDARFIVVGGGDEVLRRTLEASASAKALGGRLQWVGVRDDMPGVFSAFDIAVSSSRFGEGFSNAVAEAMACQRVCVATDVGDSRLIVGECGAIVVPGDAAALAGAIERVAGLDADALARQGAAARARIVERFSGEALLARTLQVLEA